MQNLFGKGKFSFDGKNSIYDVYYVKGLRHNLLSVAKMCSKGYKIVFQDNNCEIRKGSRTMVVVGRRAYQNIYQL